MKCLPVVASACGCVYSCAPGVETSPGHFLVSHPFWAPSKLKATVTKWCVDEDCTDAFDAEIVCSVMCLKRPADHTCHFESDRCVGH